MECNTHVLSSIIHNSQEQEATQVSIDRWKDKQNMVYLYTGILLSLKKEGDSGTARILEARWLRLQAPKEWGLGSIPSQGARSHMLQLRVCKTRLPYASTKISLNATTNTRYSHWTLVKKKKEGNSDIGYNMDEPWKHYAQWKKQVTKRQIL